MKKRNFLIITIVILLIIVAGAIYLLVSNGDNNTKTNSSIDTNAKALVLYFSVTGNTKKVSEYIKDDINADLIEIEPKEAYTSEDINYSNDDCRANKEQNDPSARPEIKNDIDVSEYDVIFLGYPIWWGDAPKIIITFLENTNLDGKTIIPFCTSGGSGIEQSVETLRSVNPNLNIEDGKRLSSSKESVTSWLNELGY